MTRDNKHLLFFLIPYFLCAILLLVGVLYYPKAELHLLMNAAHSPFGDCFFRIVTELGGGTVPFVFLGLLLFYRYSYVAYLLLAQLSGGLLSFVFKRIFDEPRPALYFREHYPEVILPVVDGVKMHMAHSFPSGHTITAFALFFGLSLVCKNKWLSLLFVVAATLAGYSRVYLSQHFAIDILAGSFIGIAMAWISYPFFTKNAARWGKRSLLNRRSCD